MVYLDDQARELISEIADIEINNIKNDSAKERWLDLADRLVQLGTKKQDVSKTITRLVQKQMRQTDPEAKFNNSWFYTIMKQNGYTDQEYHVKEIDRPIPVTEDQKIVPPEEAPTKPDLVINPEGKGIAAINLMRKISFNNINNCNAILAKTTFHRQALLDQKKNEPDEVKEKFVNAQKQLIEKRLQVVNDNLNVDHEELEKVIRHQKQSAVHLDDRSTITQWEKVMALLAIDLGYDRNEVARLLGITTKHMKINIVPEESKKHILQLLDWFKRCPGCGIQLADLFEGLIKSNVREVPKSIHKDIEPLRITKYQNEVIQLKKKVKQLEKQIRGH